MKSGTLEENSSVTEETNTKNAFKKYQHFQNR